MQPLYDMLANAQNGAAFEQMARQFGLSQEQARAAVEALTPAFSQGLKRNASDPYGLGAFLQALSTGQHAKYFEDASRAFSPQGMEEGNGILGHLFGSKELSRAVAAQAAAATGIGQETLKQMLPVLASMIMGGLYKQSAGQAQAAGNPFGELFEQMMRQGGGMAMPRYEAPQPGANPFDNPFGKALEGMFGGGVRGVVERGHDISPSSGRANRLAPAVRVGGRGRRKRSDRAIGLNKKQNLTVSLISLTNVFNVYDQRT